MGLGANTRESEVREEESLSSYPHLAERMSQHRRGEEHTLRIRTSKQWEAHGT